MFAENVNGVILAGGKGSRLWPMTLAVSKQLLPVAGRPMIYFPLATLMLAGIREIAIVVSPESEPQIKSLLGDGTRFGIRLSYTVQSKPMGIAHGFGLAYNAVKNQSTLAILGDNFFFGPKLGVSLRDLVLSKPVTRIFAKQVLNPSAFGVLQFRQDGSLGGLVEKPAKPPSDMIATGLYFFKPGDLSLTNQIASSPRGEMEVTDLLNLINTKTQVEVVKLSRSTYWSDLGDIESIDATSNFVNSIESTQLSSVLLPEIVALRNNYISREKIEFELNQVSGHAYKNLIKTELSGFNQ